MSHIHSLWSDRLKALRAEPSKDEVGDAARLARIERTRAEMRGQGAAIRATLDRAKEPLSQLLSHPRAAGIARMIIAGCGDSWFAGQLAKPVAEAALGLPCQAVQAYEHALWSSVLENENALAIGISSGGNTPAVMSALTTARSAGALAIGMSNTEGSPIMRQFDGGLFVEASRKGWPTQSTTAAAALLCKLAIELGRAKGRAVDHLDADLASFPHAVDAILDELDGAAEQGAAVLAACPMVIITGSGSDFAAASIGAAKLRELCPIHAFAVPLEEMHHYRLPKKGDGVVVLSTTKATRERALDTVLVARAEGARSLALLAEPDPDIEGLATGVLRSRAITGSFAGFLATVPLQALAYHTACKRDALGLGSAW